MTFFSTQHFSYSLQNGSIGNPDVIQSQNIYTFQYPCTDFTICTPYILFLKNCILNIELIGAKGGNSRYGNSASIAPHSGGNGSYVSGFLKIQTPTVLYLYLGGKGEDQVSMAADVYGKGGYNGGADGGKDTPGETSPEAGAGGGGASDIRIAGSGGFDGYKSRIMVASGGGGGSSGVDNIDFSEYGGAGGALSGLTNNLCANGGTQTSGFAFGYGQTGSSSRGIINGAVGGGGGGYYGSTSCDIIDIHFPYKHESQSAPEFGGAGGSSYISGFPGCNSICENSQSNNIIHCNTSIHYSGLTFTNPIMQAGSVSYPSVLQSIYTGSGLARITYWDIPEPCTGVNPYTISNLKLLFISFITVFIVLN